MSIFGAKLDYAVRALIDLALSGSGMPVQSHDIASRQGLREAYLNQVLPALRQAGLITSTRGAGGGHRLARPAGSITMWDVARATGAVSDQTRYAAVGPPAGAAETVRRLSQAMDDYVAERLATITLADLAETTRRQLDALSIAVGM